MDNPLEQMAKEIDDIVTHPENPSDDELQRISSLFYFVKCSDSNFRNNVRFDSVFKFCQKKYPKSTEKEISSRFVIIDEITNLDIGIEKEIISAVKRVVGQ